MLGYQGANTFSTNDGGASRIIYNTWDPEQDEISYSFPYFDPNSNDACLEVSVVIKQAQLLQIGRTRR